MTNVKQLLEQYSKQVTVKPSKDGQYLVVKYKREVFFKDEWDDFLRECRGMILDQDYNIVSLPFTKIHNYGVEKDAPEFVDNELLAAAYIVAATTKSPKSKGCRFDMHSGNFMLRGNQVVITDPLCDDHI